MLLNTDYKLLTKVLALQLLDDISNLVHTNQTGFIPRRSIFNNIRLASCIINYAELTKSNGVIVALDQEKAYDKIKHNYLWKTLEQFHIPETFIHMAKALYAQAYTQVTINGIFSSPFQVTRGMCQGDLLSCVLFNLAIKPLACQIRCDMSLKGFNMPQLEE